MKKSELKKLIKEIISEGVLQDAKPFTEDMKTGFLAYTRGGGDKWRYSEFETNPNDPTQRYMKTFKGNGYGYIYADAMAHKQSFFKVFDTLDKAKQYSELQNKVHRGKKEDDRLIYGKNNRW